ncbi:MAG: hypothetical protein P1S59_07135 [bacterium]|nr:hypothetical protein [bacterium]
MPIDRDAADPNTETRTSIMYAREYVDLDEIGGWLNILAFPAFFAPVAVFRQKIFLPAYQFQSTSGRI